MKKFTMLCVSMFTLIVLVACGNTPTLDTTNDKIFSESFDIMYDKLSNAEKANFLRYFPIVLSHGTMLDAAIRLTSNMPAPSEEQALQVAGLTIQTYKQFAMKGSMLGKAVEDNLKVMNGLTAEEIITKGEAILESYRKEASAVE